LRDNPGVADLGILDAVARQGRVASDASHRPWPLPDSPWSQAQTRRDVLLAHWRVPIDVLARLLPAELAADTFDGEAWLAIAAFRVAGLRIRGLPPVPGFSSFPQLEVSTPVTLDGRPGLWLFQLETPKQLVVEAAKRTHRLPAYRARISAGRTGQELRFDAVRHGLAYDVRYTPRGTEFTPVAGTLEHFLTERYALYTADGGRLYRAEVHHAPWRLRGAAAEVASATLAPLPLEGDPYLLFSRAQDVLVWPLEEI
jgi:uncharacterized protein YqjF (DUF2071 family)